MYPIYTLRAGEPGWNERLADIPPTPDQLYYSGTLELLHQPAIAIVGSRAMTRYGEEACRWFTRELGSHGYTIISGLACGIDAVAHRTALEYGYPTIAIVANGLAPQVMFPREHERLAENIVEQGGLLVSEYPNTKTAQRFQFPARNRLIAALSLGVVIIEARLKSGALVTAKYAVEGNREVFAVPGSIFSSRSSGTHQLVQHGAMLVTKPEEILMELTGEAQRISAETNTPQPQLTLEQGVLVQALESGVTSLTELLQTTSLPAEQVARNLTELEIMGIVRRNIDFTYEISHR